MKAKEAMIAWTPVRHTALAPGSRYAGTVGQVKVVPLCDRTPGWAHHYRMTWGAVVADWRKLEGFEMTFAVFREFHSIVLRDGLDPWAVHEAFLAIDEYAENIAWGVPGAREQVGLS